MASETAHIYEPRQGHGLAHDPFNAIVGPRPIGWISSLSQNGIANLAPYSFFNAFNYYPPIIGFSSIGFKDSIANILEVGEFCWNLSTRTLAKQMNISSAPAPATIDEFEIAGLTKAPSRLITAPRVQESPVNFECRLTQSLQLRRADGSAVETWMIFGEVVVVHIDRALIETGLYDTAAARPILRAGRMSDYAEITPEAMFEMRRPPWPLA
jgi:flavin reductase (DIM6/NTAB) family NADH-FMN oxidoreductase RutF